MSRKRRKSAAADDPAFVAEIADQVVRLREMLVLMAPETGMVALGASFRDADDRPPFDEQLLLPSPDAANF